VTRPGTRDVKRDPTRIVPFAPGSYARVHALQQEFVARRVEGAGGDAILIGEHERVVTLGRGTKEPVLGLPIPVVEIERGGQATWHGPGQLVAYPIVKLRDDRHDLHAWMRALEQAVIDTLEPLGLRAGRREGATGVWIDGQRKICSIGVAASRWVTYHGLALNADTALAHFSAIAPCGFEAGVMTSVRRELGAAPPLAPALQRALAAGLASFAAPR